MRTLVLFLFAITLTTQVFSQAVYQRGFPANQGYTTSSVTCSPSDQTWYYAIADANGTIMLYHLDSTGVALDVYQYTGANAASVNVEVSPIGIIYLSGTTDAAGVNYYIIAINPNGTVFWSRNYSTNSQGYYSTPKFKVLDNSNLMIIESVYGRLAYIETDPLGNVVESNSYREDTTVENKTPGFAGDVYDDGTFIFTGKRGSDILMVHANSNGDILWTTVMNSGMSYYHTKSVAALSDGSAIACGFENNSCFIMKVDSSGTLQWYNKYTSFGTIFYDIAPLDNSFFAACGDNNGTAMLCIFDMNGNEIRSTEFAQPNWAITASEFVVNSSGTIGMSVRCLDPQATYYKPALLIMESGFVLGCAMDTMSLVPSTTSADPSIVAVPIYSIPQVVTTSTISVSSSVITASTDDFCNFVSVEDSPGNPAELSIQNSPATSGQPITFSFGNLRGEMTYVVRDALGRDVLNSRIYYDGDHETVNGTELLAPGVYLLSVRSGDSVYTEKFVVR